MKKESKKQSEIEESSGRKEEKEGK